LDWLPGSRRDVALGHIALFAARLIVLIPTSIFSFLFIANRFKLQLSTPPAT
jgi:hypothetical protein